MPRLEAANAGSRAPNRSIVFKKKTNLICAQKFKVLMALFARKVALLI